MAFDLTPDSALRFSRDASDIVRRYIAAQNSVFKFSFVKALGFRKTAPDAAATTVAGLKTRVRAMLDEVRELKLDASEPLGAFFVTMRPYLRKLEEAMDFFIALCGSISAAQRDRRSRYWKDGYEKDLLEHQRREREYLKIGVELNERWKALKNST